VRATEPIGVATQPHPRGYGGGDGARWSRWAAAGRAHDLAVRRRVTYALVFIMTVTALASALVLSFG
jgi:hypothetical protein